ncbi:MAG: hypothetical protein E7583_00165 [Ruminococcaceae bacterium]|nr:hypothetical protein [Oscillospiraceae bacterium]
MKSKIVTYKGKKHIAVDGKIIDSLSMKSFRPTKNNIGDFYAAGVRVFHVYCSGLTSALGLPYSLYGETWFGDKQYDFTNLDRQIEFFRETAPDAYIFVNVHLDSRQWWHDENPGRPSSFTHLSQIASDEKWRCDTAEYLKALIRHTEEKYNDIVIGYWLLGGTTTEWFSRYDREASHPIKLRAYKKYMNDENAHIPEDDELVRPENQIFLDGANAKDLNLINYRKFHNRLIADTVVYFCHEAQKVLKHQKVLGVFYGYIMELRGRGMWHDGHLDTDTVYRSPDIDLIATPSSYQFRNYDDASANMLMCDSIELCGMMYYCSFDHRTFKVPDILSDERRICEDAKSEVGITMLNSMRTDVLPTRKHTIDAMRREYMQKLAKRTGMWWFDMLEGWFYDDGLMEEVKKTVDISKKLCDIEMRSASEIAVFVSCESLFYVNKECGINSEVLCNWRDALARMGAPYDVYSLNDIDRVSIDKYKLIILPDAFYLTDSQRSFINSRLKGGNRTILFAGACDYANDDGLSLERVKRLVGMEIDILETDENTIHAMDSTFGYEKAKTPTLYVNDDSAQIVGRYALSRKCALAKKGFDGYTVYYSGLGNFSHTVLREIAREAGVHIYTENGVACYVNSLVAGVYNTKNEETVITLPSDGEFTEIFSGIKYKTENRKVTLPTGENPAQMLIIG